MKDAKLTNSLLFEGTFYVVHKDKDGNIISSDPFPIQDLITNEGIDYILNTAIHNGAGHSISNEIIATGDGTTTSFSPTLAQKPQPASLSISYTISATTYTATDDGAGNISGTSCSGTVNYSTGAVSLTFTSAPDSATDVTASYSSAITDWYFAPFTNDYTPTNTDTYATPGYIEANTEYSENNRQGWNEGASSSQSITNTTVARITAATAVTFYGAGIVGGGTAASTKADTAGGSILLSSGRFSAAKTLAAGETLDLSYTLNGSSA